MKTPMRIMAVASALALLILTTFSGEKIALAPTAAHWEQQNIEVMGSWMVQGQSAMQYSLTFYPDETFNMTYAGKQSKGTYTVGDASVTLVLSGGGRLTLKFVKGPDMMKDRLVDDQGISWMRV